MVKTFVCFWGLLGLIFVRDSQMPTEQREVGICGMICQSLYLSYASASQSAVLAHAVATTPKRGEHAIRATGPAWLAGSTAHGRHTPVPGLSTSTRSGIPSALTGASASRPVNEPRSTTSYATVSTIISRSEL